MVMRFIFRQSPHLSARFETQNGLPNNRDMIMEGKKVECTLPIPVGRFQDTEEDEDDEKDDIYATISHFFPL